MFGGWCAAAPPLAQVGVFNVPAGLGDPPVVFVFLFGGMAVIRALAWFTPLGRRVTLATPLGAIAAFQIPRLMGGLFLIGWAAGDIPSGLGDILDGIPG